MEGRGLFAADGVHAAGLERGDQQPEAGDGDGVGVEVHAEDLIQGALGQRAGVGAGLVRHPQLEQPPKGPEQEMAGAAGGVDEAHLAETELFDGRGEGAVEDEFLDELRGLEQGVTLARGLGEVLVKVPEKAGVPVGVGEIMDQRPGVRVYPLPETQEPGGPVAGGPQGPEGVVLGVEQLGGGRVGTHLVEAVEQVVAVRMGAPVRVAEVQFVLIQGALAPLAGAGQQRCLDEGVVLQEAHKDAAQDPGDRGLGEEGLAPDLVGVAGAPGLLRGPILVPQARVDLRHGPHPIAQVVLQLLEQALEVLQQLRGVDHGSNSNFHHEGTKDTKMYFVDFLRALRAFVVQFLSFATAPTRSRRSSSSSLSRRCRSLSSCVALIMVQIRIFTTKARRTRRSYS